MKKALIAFLIVLGVTLLPLRASTKDNGPETVVLSESNLLVLNSEINGDSVGEVIFKARELDSKLSGKFGLNKQPLYLFINSPGGSIQSGLEMFEALQGMGRKIDTITLFGASMAFQTVQALGDRLIIKNGVLMSHRAAGEIQGSFGGARPSQMDNRYQLWLDRVRELDEQTVARSNGRQTYESYTHQYQNELWLTGTKAVEQGYADRVVLVKCDSSLNGAITKHTTFMGMDVSYDLDKCPLNTNPLNIKVTTPDGKVINAELVNKVKEEFLSGFVNKQKQVIPMVF